MEITIEDVGQFLESNPEAQVKAKEILSNKGFYVLDKSEQEGVLNDVKENGANIKTSGFLNEFKEQYSKPLIRGIHDRYDNDFKELGIEKEQNEKSYEAFKRGWASNQDKIKDLEAKIANGEGNEAMKQKIADLEADAQRKIADANKKYSDLEKEYSTTLKKGAINDVYGSLKKSFKDSSQLGSFFKTHEESVLDKVTSNSVKDGDVWYMSDSEGNILKDNNYNGITVESYLKDQFKDAFKEERPPSGGAGSGRDSGVAYPIDVSTIDANNYRLGMGGVDVKDANGLINDLSALGIVRGSKQYTEIYSKWSKQIGK